MEKNPERIDAVNNLLSQSYNDGVQKIVGHEQDTPLDFQIPQQILEKRKATWNSLFKKYSTMESEIAFNIKTLVSEAIEDMQQVVEESTDSRLPMRKSMSMVQYWVDTGNQPYMETLNNRTRSENGSSLAEEEIIVVDEDEFLPTVNINSSPEKQSEAVGISESKLMRIVSSSSSSVDTAAYILANNNTTKKADTLAIVEGSKVVDSLQSLNVVDNVNNVKKNIENHFVSKNTRQTRSKVSKASPHEEKIVNKTNDSEELDLDKTKILSDDSNREELKNLPSIMTNESDELVFKSRFSIGGQRKKLYNNRESPAEFTPASVTSSHKALRLSMKQCEHPAFQTPTYSKATYIVKKRRQRFRRKKHRHLLSQISLSKSSITKSSLKDDSIIQSPNSTKFKTQNSNDESKVNLHKIQTNQNKSNKNFNLKSLDDNNHDCISVQPLDRRKTLDVNKSLDYNERFDLKTVFLVLHRLPYKYENIKFNSDETMNSKNDIVNQKEEKRLLGISKRKSKHLNIASSDYELSDDLHKKLIDDQKRYGESPLKKGNLRTKSDKVLVSRKKKNSDEETIITNINTTNHKNSKSHLENIKASESTDNNILITSQNKTAIEKSNVDKNKISFDKSIKYVPVLSSSDESETVITVSSKKLRKRLLKRKINNDKKVDDDSENETKKILNSKRKITNYELKSTEIKYQESEEVSTSNSTAEQQTILSSTDKGYISPVKKKFFNSNVKKIDNKNENSVDITDVKKNLMHSTNDSNKNPQVSLQTKSLNQNENEKVSPKLINKTLTSKNVVNKIKIKSNDSDDTHDSFLTKKQKSNIMQSNKSDVNESNNVSKKVKLTTIKKIEQIVQSKKNTFDEDYQDLKDINSNKNTERKSKRVKNNSKTKADEILILSDDECFVPLKMNVRKD